MEDPNTIRNRIAESGLITFDMESFLQGVAIEVIDIKPWLYKELIIREKDFRAAVKEHDWSTYKDKWVGVHCSNEAIIPTWAYMLISVHLQPYTQNIAFGSEQAVYNKIISNALATLDTSKYKDERIMVKGCSKFNIPESCYMEVVQKLTGIARSVMYGDACANVPLFKRKA